jgi:Protein of unknown function (DUF2637)
VSFLALRDLMRVIGYSSSTAWIFPAIIDTAVAVSTLMLVALGDKPARRYRTVTIQAGSHTLTAAEPPPPDVAEVLAKIHRNGGAHPPDKSQGESSSGRF